MNMAVAVLPKALSQDVLNDNKSYEVPEDVYVKEFEPLLEELKALGVDDPSTVEFDASKHLLFTDDYFEKTPKHTLEALGLTELHQKPISPIAVTEPFPFFTEEAILLMRYELFTKEIFLKCARTTNQSNAGENLNFSVGNYPKDMAPFTHAAWGHPRTMEIISKMAGVELTQLFNSLVAGTNLSLRTPASILLEQIHTDYDNPDEIPGIVSWHFDSPQFVCVLMLSDTSKMVGGETCLIQGNGKVAKVANPKRGWANVLQGRVVKHIAPKPAGEYTERITQVTALRPVDPMLDASVMSTIKPSVYSMSRYNEFYKDWMNYRLEVLSKRIEVLKKQVNAQIDKGELFDQIETINFMQKHIVEYVEHTWQEFEVVDDGQVEKPASYNVRRSMWI